MGTTTSLTTLTLVVTVHDGYVLGLLATLASDSRIETVAVLPNA